MATRNIYIDDSAPTGDGSIGDPYNSFSDINWTTGGDNSIFDWVAADDDVYINLKRGCVWREQLTVGTSGVSGHPITIQAYGTGADPIINGTDIISGNWSGPDGNGEYTDDSIDTECKIVIVDDTLWTLGTAGSLAATEWDWTAADGGTLFLGANPAALVVQASQRDKCINWITKDYIDFTNLSFKHSNGKATPINAGTYINWTGCSWSEIGTYGLQITNAATDITFDTCTFVDWGLINGQQYGIQVIGGAGKSGPVDITDSTFTINHTFNTTETTPVMCDTNGWVRNFQRNTINGNGKMYGSGVMWWQVSDQATTITVEDNKFYNTGNAGIQFNDLITTSSEPVIRIRRNYIEDACHNNVIDTEAIRLRDFPAAVDIEVSYNIINGTDDGDNDHHGIQIDDIQDGKIYNNVIVGTDLGIYVDRIDGVCTGWDIRNNILMDNRLYGVSVDTTSGCSITTLDYNCYHNNTSGNTQNISVGAHGVEADPMFRDAANGIFNLRWPSSCINKGVDVGLTEDSEGKTIPIGGAFDIGAIETYREIWFKRLLNRLRLFL